MPLTDVKIRTLKPSDKPQKYSDGGGLYLQVSPSGSKLWRMAYRFSDRQKTLSFGVYPTVSLAQARALRDQAKQKLADGIDPGEEVRREKIKQKFSVGTTFSAIATELIAKAEAEGKSEATLRKKRWFLDLLEQDLGRMAITEINATDVLAPLKRIERRGNYETARRVRAFASQVFRYAIATARTQYDPTFGLRGALIAPQVEHRAAIVDPAEFSRLLVAVWSYGGRPATTAALKLMALLYPRPGELRQAQWSEFDLGNKVWTIPAERAKMRREHKKPLTDASVQILETLHHHTGHGDLVFPALGKPDTPISENTMNQALRRMGFDSSQHTAHGFRASASTMLNESGLWSSDAIEVELAHIDTNAVRRAYHRATYWDERVKMAEWWAIRVEEMRAQHNR
jgi:integrase